jgi:hypothetical protein
LELEQARSLPVEQREPCPRCDSRNLQFEHVFAASQATTAAVAKTVGKTTAAAVVASASVSRRLLPAARWLYEVTRAVIRPAPPDHGYHTVHPHEDLVGGALIFGFAMTAVFMMTRMLGRIARDAL